MSFPKLMTLRSTDIEMYGRDFPNTVNVKFAFSDTMDAFAFYKHMVSLIGKTFRTDMMDGGDSGHQSNDIQPSLPQGKTMLTGDENGKLQ